MLVQIADIGEAAWLLAGLLPYEHDGKRVGVLAGDLERVVDATVFTSLSVPPPAGQVLPPRLPPA